jgi:chitinase
MQPKDIPLGYYTHINFAFGLIDPNSFNVVPMEASMVPLFDQVTILKQQQVGLQTWISIGGWSFNDPGSTQKTFSNLAGSASAQSNFFNSLISFMKRHEFDGVDIDW